MNGGTIWVFDENRRVYSETDRGAPIWREHWRPCKVTGETSRSWLIAPYGKVPKRGADPRKFAFSQADIDEQAYVHDHVYKISECVRRLTRAATLREVAVLVGYKP